MVLAFHNRIPWKYAGALEFIHERLENFAGDAIQVSRFHHALINLRTSIKAMVDVFRYSSSDRSKKDDPGDCIVSNTLIEYLDDALESPLCERRALSTLLRASSISLSNLTLSSVGARFRLCCCADWMVNASDGGHQQCRIHPGIRVFLLQVQCSSEPATLAHSPKPWIPVHYSSNPTCTEPCDSYARVPSLFRVGQASFAFRVLISWQ